MTRTTRLTNRKGRMERHNRGNNLYEKKFKLHKAVMAEMMNDYYGDWW